MAERNPISTKPAAEPGTYSTLVSPRSTTSSSSPPRTPAPRTAPSQQPTTASTPPPPATPVSIGTAAATSVDLDFTPGPRPTVRMDDPAPREDVLVERLETEGCTDERLVMVLDPDSERAAAFRVLAQRLTKHHEIRSLCVTSAEPGEGKTTCALNLALALAECGRARVALLEANLRAPALATMLRFVPRVCFVQQMAAHRARPDEPWRLVEAFAPTLHVGAVRPDSPPGPLVDAVALALAVERIKQSGYDYVIVDAPSVLHHADVNVVEEAVDAVLLAARAGTSRARLVRRAVEQLGHEKVLGVVLVDA